MLKKIINKNLDFGVQQILLLETSAVSCFETRYSIQKSFISHIREIKRLLLFFSIYLDNIVKVNFKILDLNSKGVEFTYLFKTLFIFNLRYSSS